jgi:hypothetical protein
MGAILALVMAALGGGDGAVGARVGERPNVQELATAAAKSGPAVSFEIREITVASPEWRGRMLASLQPVARQEGAAVWALDEAGIKDLLTHCQADPRCRVAQAPAMTARIGEPVRMSSETAHNYVAHLKRVSDAPPNQGTQIAFQPEVDKVHSGVRVSVLSSELRGQALFAKIVIEENRLVAFHTAEYAEGVKSKPPADPALARASLRNLARLNPAHGPEPARIKATIQVPEVDSRRVEGQWLVPGDGALLVSLGPCTRHDGMLRRQYEEKLIAITARPAGGEAPVPTRPATQPSPVQSTIPQPITGTLPRTR